MTSLKNYLFYSIKPVVPRSIQLSIRRYIAGKKRRKYAHIWPINEGAGAPPTGWKGWPDGKQFAFFLHHDVDTQCGHDKCSQLMDLEEKLGVRSTFFIVPQRYAVSDKLLNEIKNRGFGLGVHGLRHDGKLFLSYDAFCKKAVLINNYLHAWDTAGFSSPSMICRHEWLHHLDIEYSTSTFDTDPFEPEPDAEDTIFPFVVKEQASGKSYVELPYTLPQDFTLFIILKEINIDIWKSKLDWIAARQGMVLLNTHPDYMNFEGDQSCRREEYPVRMYRDFLTYVQTSYAGRYWNPLSREAARHFKQLKIEHKTGKRKRKKIWIDLDNTPHVPFFRPIVQELEKKNITVTLTLRENAQTCEMADLFHFKYKKIGKHYGKNKVLKLAGTLYRALQLFVYIFAEKPDLAVSHGSRAMVVLSKLLRIPVIGISDYEHAKAFFYADWLMAPEMIQASSFHLPKERIITYPGIKEDVYVPFFKPDPAILNEFNVPKDHIIAVIRPPAVEAHYHNPESDKLFEAVIDYFAEKKNITMIVLPRYTRQGGEIKTRYRELVEKRLMIIPEKVYDGLNIIWYSDFVVSGGGTMNREAAALGVPVYSIFRGKIGAVDRYLSNNGRLVLLESVDDVRTKIKLEKRNRPAYPAKTDNKTLDSVVGSIIALLK